ncbi:MAG TPA: thioredoxin domain-containing protein [Gemmatimonadales bacterium]|nr:thioredoxin domain-containing protein [Gemmatimonadales bacterium]
MKEVSSRVRTISDIVTTIAVVAAAASLVWRVFASPAIGTGRQVAVTELDGDIQPRDDVARLGSPTAGIALIEFVDFECPFCRRYAQDALKVIEREYIEPRHVQYLSLHLPLDEIHPHALDAAQAAQCAAAAGLYWQMHGRLFGESRPLERKVLLTNAVDLGLPGSSFEECLQGQTDSAITHDRSEAQRLGVVSTPTFLIGAVQSDGRIRLRRRIVGAQPYRVFKDALDEALAGK